MRDCGLGQEMASKDFYVGKTQVFLFDRSNKTGVIDDKMDGSVLEKKSSFKVLGLTFLIELGLCSQFKSFL